MSKTIIGVQVDGILKSAIEKAAQDDERSIANFVRKILKEHFMREETRK
jgi:hypothetical protein